MKDAFSVLSRYKVENVLDAATGRGDFINVLRQNLGSFVQIIGVDSSSRSVDQAQKLFPENDVEIYQMDLEDLQFEDAHFDLVTLSNSMHHLEHLDKVLAELLRVLKPGGTMLIHEMYRDGEQTESQQTHILLHHWLAGIDSRFGTYHRETYTRDELRAFVKKLKLQKLSETDFYVPVDNPKEAKNCDNLMRNITDTFKRLETLPDNEQLMAEGKELLERIERVGCAGASRLLFIGVKPAAPTKPITKGDK
jgi:ubiquinone/menaquinone biosynthesis C-methylase UbiE